VFYAKQCKDTIFFDDLATKKNSNDDCFVLAQKSEKFTLKMTATIILYTQKMVADYLIFLLSINKTSYHALL
jgi:hypothetical protein